MPEEARPSSGFFFFPAGPAGGFSGFLRLMDESGANTMDKGAEAYQGPGRNDSEAAADGSSGHYAGTSARDDSRASAGDDAGTG